MSEISKEKNILNEVECDVLRSIEQKRLAALVERNIEQAGPLHADDFQLITPIGLPLSKEQYLGAIATGTLIYHTWDPKHIEVRLYERVAVIRYPSSLAVTFGPHHVPITDYWHTDLYEKRDGAWQVVWSQATEIRSVS